MGSSCTRDQTCVLPGLVCRKAWAANKITVISPKVGGARGRLITCRTDSPAHGRTEIVCSRAVWPVPRTPPWWDHKSPRKEKAEWKTARFSLVSEISIWEEVLQHMSQSWGSCSLRGTVKEKNAANDCYRTDLAGPCELGSWEGQSIIKNTCASGEVRKPTAPLGEGQQVPASQLCWLLTTPGVQSSRADGTSERKGKALVWVTTFWPLKR